MTIRTILLHPALLSGAMLAVLWAALEVGRWLGRRKIGVAKEGGGGAIDAAVFALLGLLIAFTFSGAAARFDHRRELIVQEANAIGTAWLRIDTVPVAAQPGLRHGFRAYIESRKAAYAVVADRAAFRAALARSAQTQKELWALAIDAGRRPDALPAANILLLPALNDMIDITTTRAMATEMHPPATPCCSRSVVVGAVLAGFGMGTSAARSWIHMLAFTATMAITITVIIDMEYPRLGMINVDGFERDAFALGLPQ